MMRHRRYRRYRLPWPVDVTIGLFGCAAVFILAPIAPILALAVGFACYAVPAAFEAWKS